MWSSPLRPTSSVFPRSVSATYRIHSLPSADLFYKPLPIIHTVFPWYTVCKGIGDTRFAATAVPLPSGQEKKAASHTFCLTLCTTFPMCQGSPTTSAIYTLSCIFLAGNGQLPSHVLGRRSWTQGIIIPTLWAILALRLFVLGGEISTWALAIVAFLSSPDPSTISFLGETATSLSHLFSVGPPSLLQHLSSLSPSSF